MRDNTNHHKRKEFVDHLLFPNQLHFDSVLNLSSSTCRYYIHWRGRRRLHRRHHQEWIEVTKHNSSLAEGYRTPKSPPIVVGGYIPLIALHQQVVGGELNGHIHLEWLAVEEDQAFMVGQNEPRKGRGQVIPDHIAFFQRVIHPQDGVDIVGRRTRPKLGTEQTQRNRLQIRRDNHLLATGMDLQACVIPP